MMTEEKGFMHQDILVGLFCCLHCLVFKKERQLESLCPGWDQGISQGGGTPCNSLESEAPLERYDGGFCSFQICSWGCWPQSVTLKNWVGVCRSLRIPKTLTLFMTKISNPIYDISTDEKVAS